MYFGIAPTCEPVGVGNSTGGGTPPFASCFKPLRGPCGCGAAETLPLAASVRSRGSHGALSQDTDVIFFLGKPVCQDHVTSATVISRGFFSQGGGGGGYESFIFCHFI